MPDDASAELAVDAVLEVGRKLLAESRRLIDELDAMVLEPDGFTGQARPRPR